MKKARTLSKITLANEDELFSSDVNQALFEKKYPQLYDAIKDQFGSMERWEVEELLPNNDSIKDVLLEKEAVFLHLRNGEIVSIYNTEIIAFNGLESDGFSVYSESGFIYFLISIAGGQAGSLGIWSLAERRWIFTHRDDGFCVRAIIFLPQTNCFVGFTEWYHWGSAGGESFFFINSDRGYTDMKLNKLEGFDWESISLEARNEISLEQDAALVFDQTQDALYRIIGSKRLAFRLDEAQIRALQHKATSKGWLDI